MQIWLLLRLIRQRFPLLPRKPSLPTISTCPPERIGQA
uniref:Uncharacterized protein n=1 Tax=Rhizophora mucronata TaxID=61149 RepID=A0A2P2MVT8_RHIMU